MTITPNRAALELAAGTLTHTHTLTGPSTAVLDPVTSVLTLDDTWSPYGHLRATLRGDTAALLDALDPRQSPRPRISIEAGYIYADGTVETEDFGALLVTRIARDGATGRLSIDAHTDEVILQRAAWRGPAVPSIPTTSVAAVIAWALAQIGASLVVEDDAPADTMPALDIKPGTNLWDFAANIAGGAGLWLRHDGTAWRLGRRGVDHSTMHNLATGPAGTVHGYTDTRDLDEWADAILVTATWTDSAGVTHTTSGDAKAHAAAATWSHVELNTPMTDAGCANYAAARLARSTARGRGVSPLHARSAYWLRPGHAVTVTATTAPQERHRSRSLTFEWPAGRMQVSTSLPHDMEA